ncbi:MAG: amidohydrolase family protein [Myxococcales bacterium]|nr:amidohydrolase family protein [Myxococcales bacterium]MCB9580735.1 amidohydrolase family protein [Polyangiaceae bacterium]
MARLSRRALLGVGASFTAGLVVGGRLGAPQAFAPGPPRAVDGDAKDLVLRALEGLDPAKVWDTHVHVVGIGTGNSGCWVNPKMRSAVHPVRQFEFDVYLAASGVSDMSRVDEEYIERLLTLSRLANPQGKIVCLPFDIAVREDGSEDWDQTEVYTPNEYVAELGKKHANVVPGASIHPYRKDAVERLDKAVEAGARVVKWLPNSMGMDPASPKCDAFYERLATLDVPLLCHTGEEQAVQSDEWQELGNPLRLRRALEKGVRVVAAHCASLGSVRDLDDPMDRSISAFDALLRMLNDRRWEKNLFADISAMTQVQRAGRPLRDMLIAKHLHPRLLYGSDYPLPAIDPLVSTRLLEGDGYITGADRALLNRIYAQNPLLFDFVLKRRLSVEHMNASYAFEPKVFETAWLYDRPSAEG